LVTANNYEIVCTVSKNNEAAKKIKTAALKNTKQVTKNSAPRGYIAYSRLRRRVVQLRASALVAGAQPCATVVIYPFTRLAIYKKTHPAAAK